eukprot:1180294-Prorocentrum_minimum.AAC.1
MDAICPCRDLVRESCFNRLLDVYNVYLSAHFQACLLFGTVGDPGERVTWKAVFSSEKTEIYLAACPSQQGGAAQPSDAAVGQI